MVNPMVLSLRKSQMTTKTLAVYNAVTSSGQTLASVATASGYTQDDTEKHLAHLVDDALVTRSVGQRMSATFQLA